ncbi:MAG TPA: tRNA (guanosine(37)-N1)-methyltransferase TrmD [Actinomycetota bacterium]|nr:tRNA (guanosine(37)-N1)-methyltransferase TrmD [Actinomycetota bacterium]
MPRIDVVTIFPELFEVPLKTSLLGKAVADGLLEVGVHDLRRHGLGKHRSVDDEPYGGGPGMVMRPEPIFAAVDELRTDDSRVVLMSARGTRLDHAVVERLSNEAHLILICGRFEGVDERVALHCADEEISLGDFVLAGGEIAALAVIEAISRLVPGVLGNEESLAVESHRAGELEYPQYTRPAEFRGHRVPDVLLSGHHGDVDAWRRDQAATATTSRRRDPAGDAE